jgi:hypothetical protein
VVCHGSANLCANYLGVYHGTKWMRINPPMVQGL